MQRSYLSLAATMMALSAFGTYANAEESPVEESPGEPAEMARADDNAMEETKKLADHITESNDNHGVAVAIEKFIFNS